jgi:hypothetical protein
MLEHFEMDYKNLNSYTMNFDSLYISSNLDMTLKEKCFYFVAAFNDKDIATSKLAKFLNEHAALSKKTDQYNTIISDINKMNKEIEYAEFIMGKNKKAIVGLADEATARKYIQDERMIQYLYPPNEN